MKRLHLPSLKLRLKKNGNFLGSSTLASSQQTLWSISKKTDKKLNSENPLNNTGFYKKLILKGIGFKSVGLNKGGQGTYLFLDIGYSHYYFIKIPLSVRVLTRKQEIFFYGLNSKYLLENFVSHIRNLRLPDQYKGKGIHFEGQVINYKKGKQR